MLNLVLPRRASFIVAAAALATLAGTGDAQQPAPLRQAESVPVELAAALISAGGFGADPQILVGSMPEWIAGEVYVPPDANVAGSAFLGSSVVAVLNIPTASDDILVDYRNGLLKRGWQTPPPPTFYGGGFRPAPPPGDVRPTRVLLCKEQQMVNAWAVRHRGVATDITVRITPVGMGTTCHPSPLPRGYRPSALPTLFNPQVAAQPRDCQRGNSLNGTSTMLRTPMTADAILDHYGRQLQDSGWKAISDGGSIVGRTWTKPDSTGAPTQLSITVSLQPDASCRDIDLSLRMTRLP